MSLITAEEDVLVTFFSSTAQTAFGTVAELDTEIFRSNNASWRITYASDHGTHGMQVTETTIPSAELTPFKDVGYFRLYYRSDKAGVIRFIPKNSAHLDIMDPASGLLDFPVAVTDEWTKVMLPFFGWSFTPETLMTNWNLMIRGWGEMAGGTVHYDDIEFVVPKTTGEATVPYASTPVLINGTLDDAYSHPPEMIYKPATGVATPPEFRNLSALWRSAFDGDNLYLFVEVIDNTWISTTADSWRNDGIELFIDGDNSNGGGAHQIKLVFNPQADGTVMIDRDPYPFNPAGRDLSGVVAAYKLRSSGDYKGYYMEIKLPLQALGITAEDGWDFGIDFQVNDGDTPGVRDNLVTWVGSDLNNNPAAYGTASLGELPDLLPVTGVSVSPSFLQLAIGAKSQLTHQIAPANATSQGVSWESDTPAVATVSATGEVTAVSAGEAIITVTTDDGEYTDSVTVNVSEPESFHALIGAEPTGEESEYHSDWFGRFISGDEYGDWIYHEGLGWMNTDQAHGGDALWLWSYELDNWSYVDAELFPFIWIAEEGWIYYAIVGGVAKQWDYNFDRWYNVAATQHPYLYFSAEDIPEIRERFLGTGVTTRRNAFLGNVNSILSSAPVTEARVGMGNSVLLSFAYIVTGEVQYANKAIEAALATAALSQWHNIHSFNRGADLVSSERTFGVAIVYDWCHDVLTEEQRVTLRTALLNKGIEPYLSSIDPNLSENWWTYHHYNNWRAVCHGGSNVGALAIFHESKRARHAARAGYEHIPLTLLEHLLTDSGGHEGPGYYNYGIEFALKAVTAQQRFFGGHEELLHELGEERLGNYWDIYMHAPDLAYINFSRHPDWGTGLWSQSGAQEGGPNSIRSALFDSLISGGDQLLRWAADNGGQRFYWRAASPLYFLWRRDAPSMYRENKPALQDAAYFRGVGQVILQSDDLYFGFNGGAPHVRGDIGAFALIAGNERMIHLEPSLSFLGSEFQSTLLVNNTGQNISSSVMGEYLQLAKGEDYKYFAASIRSAYNLPSLTKAVRHFTMVRGKYIVILDDLAASGTVSFEMRFQTTRDIQLGTRYARLRAPQRDLHIVSEGFDAFTFGQGTGGALKHVRLTRQGNQAKLLNVLYPTARDGAAPVVTVDGGVVTITHGDETDVLTFVESSGSWRLASVNSETVTAGVDVDAYRVVPYRDGREDAEVPVWLMEAAR